MAKSSRALSGAAKNAYLKRAINAETGIHEAGRERLTTRLQSEIALISLKPARPQLADPPAQPQACSRPLGPEAGHADRPTSDLPGFDPYQPNVIVVIRTRGRDAVLAQLAEIADVDQLRLLAREQQLGIAPSLASAPEIRQAIVAAAERRIANRRAAAS